MYILLRETEKSERINERMTNDGNWGGGGHRIDIKNEVAQASFREDC